MLGQPSKSRQSVARLRGTPTSSRHNPSRTSFSSSSRSCRLELLDDGSISSPRGRYIPVASPGETAIPNLASIWQDDQALAWERIEATRPAISYRDHHLHRFDTNMDNLRNSLSKFKTDVKHQLRGRTPKGNKPGPGGREEGLGSSGSLPQPESHVLVGGDREREGDRPNVENENVGAGTAADTDRPDWKITASSSAKLVLRGVRDSADAFGPLKSVAGGLCFILENCEVRYPPHKPSVTFTCPQRTKANKQAIESLAPRVKELAELLCEPVGEGDVKEGERRTRLER